MLKTSLDLIVKVDSSIRLGSSNFFKFVASDKEREMLCHAI